MSIQPIFKNLFSESTGTLYIGSPEAAAGEWIDPNLDQNEHHEFLEATRKRTRGIIPVPEFVQQTIHFEGVIIDDKKE